MTSHTKAAAVSVLLLSIIVAAVIYIETGAGPSMTSRFVDKTKSSVSLQSLIGSRGDELEVHRQLEADVTLEPNAHEDMQKRVPVPTLRGKGDDIHRSGKESFIRMDRMGKVRGSMVDPDQTEEANVANQPRVRRMAKLKTFEY